MLSFRSGDGILTAPDNQLGVRPSVPLTAEVGARLVKITPEQIPPGAIVTLYSSLVDGTEVIIGVLFGGTMLPAATPTPTPTPTPTRQPVAAPRPVLASVSHYSPLLAQAASNLPAEYDFVSDGLSAEERNILDWADSRLFTNENFLQSKWRPDNWPLDNGGQGASSEDQTKTGCRMRSHSQDRRSGWPRSRP